MHLGLLREHNRIAEELLGLNETKKIAEIIFDATGEFTSEDEVLDELIYQVARRIVIAESQQITYNEWLKVVLNCDTRVKFDLNLPSDSRKTTTYNKNVAPSILNSMATAAFRYGHGLVRSEMGFLNGNRNLAEKTELGDIFNNPELFLQNFGRRDNDIGRFMTTQLVRTPNQ